MLVVDAGGLVRIEAVKELHLALRPIGYQVFNSTQFQLAIDTRFCGFISICIYGRLLISNITSHSAVCAEISHVKSEK